MFKKLAIAVAFIYMTVRHLQLRAQIGHERALVLKQEHGIPLAHGVIESMEHAKIWHSIYTKK